MGFEKFVVRFRKWIIGAACLLMIPSLIGMITTRINYDMLTYLPEDMDTVKGQNELLDDFGKGAFSFVVCEGMTPQEVSNLREEIAEVPHVETALWYDSVLDLDVPRELLPDDIYDAFNNGENTMIAVFFDTSTSADETMDAIRAIRSLANKKVFVSGMSAMVTDLKDLCEEQEPIYVAIAVALACLAMIVFLDNWIIPFVFLASIGAAILLNLGTNLFLGQISYITKALSAVLQLAVTMDYSIFLWHAYEEQRRKYDDNQVAMEYAIHDTMVSIIGSSITTIAGFIALCFMSFTLGKDLGIVMAKGVVLGVLSCLTLLPALILCLNKPLDKMMHKPLMPDMGCFSGWVVSHYKLLAVIFLLCIPPAYYGYQKTNDEVYYNISESLPEYLPYKKANAELEKNFDVATTHMLLIDSDTSESSVQKMADEMENVQGISYVLGLDPLLGDIPEDMIPDNLKSQLESGKWKLMLMNSSYEVATDECNEQIDQLTEILHKYDKGGMVIGEASCTKDMIETTAHDFKVVDAVSILMIFIIIAFVEKSYSLPFILISVIELAIFINLGLPHYLGESLPFIAPICISTIQLGATVDYAILMTTRFRQERRGGAPVFEALKTALSTSIPSIIVSGTGLFAATFGVAVYSDIDMISSMCMLMARGALISVVCVIFFLPALLRVFDKLIEKTTKGMKPSAAAAPVTKE